MSEPQALKNKIEKIQLSKDYTEIYFDFGSVQSAVQYCLDELEGHAKRNDDNCEFGVAIGLRAAKVIVERSFPDVCEREEDGK